MRSQLKGLTKELANLACELVDLVMASENVCADTKPGCKNIQFSLTT